MAADAGLGIVFAAVLAVTVYRLAAAGIGVTATGWLTARPGYGTSAPVEFGILGWVAAVAAGLALRFADQRRRATDESIRRQERLTLARELHDVVAHHVTGIVLQAQAARIVSQDSPHELDQMLTEIEAAGTEAMTAMSRVVTLLRDPDDAAPASRKRRRRTPVTIKVLLADDQAIVRRGLRLILDAQPGITVIAEAADGAETVALARQLRPDVCLPGRHQDAQARRYRGHPDARRPHPADRGGPRRARRRSLISPSVTVRLLRHLAPARTRTTTSAAQPLTGRETEVTRAIARGRTNQEIAAELFISLSTVKGHLTAIQRKLGARNRVEIAAWAWETRLMEPPRQ